MYTIRWKSKDWRGRKLLFTNSAGETGFLHFNNAWNLNAVFQMKKVELLFTEKGFWKKTVHIEANSVEIGQVENRHTTSKILRLNSGKMFELTTNFWGRNLRWKDLNGEIIASYIPGFSLVSMGKGEIQFNEELPEDMMLIMAGTGLFLKLNSIKKAAVIMG
jgi:hypothetical protein